MCAYVYFYLQLCLGYVSPRIVKPGMGEINIAIVKLYQTSASSHSAGENVNGSVGP